MKNKFQCRSCDKIIFNFPAEKLVAPHPFIEGAEIFGCPHCQQCEEGFTALCDSEYQLQRDINSYAINICQNTFDKLQSQGIIELLQGGSPLEVKKLLIFEMPI